MTKSSPSPSVAPATSNRSLRYRRLVLRIGADPASPGGLVTEVLDSPVGQTGKARFEVPLAARELARLGAAMEGVARRHVRPRHKAAQAPPPNLTEVGRALGEALFVGPVAEALHRSQQEVEARAEGGLRIEIRVEPSIEQASDLCALPWELLVAPRDLGPLSLSRGTTVVRFLELPRRRRPPDQPERLRILAVAPRPRALPVLDQGRELEDLRHAWTGSDRVEVETLQPPTLEALRQALKEALHDRPFHGLHFMGHGRFDPERGLGELLFEDEAGEPDPVDAALLAGQMRDLAGRIRVVVLNACQSARAGALEPGLGVAQALVATGVPAVVAMQFPVSDRAALSFSKSLYRSLAEGDPVDAAVAEGRLAIVRDLRDSPEWATPALFLAAEDGRLFAPTEAAPGGRARAPAPAVGRVVEGFAVSVLAGLLVAFLATLSGGRWWETAPTEPPRQPWLGRTSERGPGAGFEPESEPGPASSDPAARRPGTVPETEVGKRSDEIPTAEPLSREAYAAPTVHTVPAGEAIRLPEVGASVRVDFLARDREEYVLVVVSPDGGEVVHHPVVGHKTFEIEAGGRSFFLHVLGVDYERRTVELRAALLP